MPWQHRKENYAVEGKSQTNRRNLSSSVHIITSLSLSFPLRIQAISIVSREEQKKSWDRDFIFWQTLAQKRNHIFLFSPLLRLKKAIIPRLSWHWFMNDPLEYGRGNGWRLLCCARRQRGRVKKMAAPQPMARYVIARNARMTYVALLQYVPQIWKTDLYLTKIHAVGVR